MLDRRMTRQAMMLATLTAAAALSTVARGAEPTEELLQDITVTSARVITVGRSQIGGPRQEGRLSRAVKAEDLDLGTPAGMAELEKRIRQMSEELCTELDRIYPLDEPQARTCTEATVKRTMADVLTLTGASQ